LLLIGRERALYGLGSIEQRMFALFERIDLGLGDRGFFSRARGQLKHQHQSDERYEENRRTQRPRNEAIAKWFRGQIKTVIHRKKILAETLSAGRLGKRIHGLRKQSQTAGSPTRPTTQSVSEFELRRSAHLARPGLIRPNPGLGL
jgi:hypothetical protein